MKHYYVKIEGDNSTYDINESDVDWFKRQAGTRKIKFTEYQESNVNVKKPYQRLTTQSVKPASTPKSKAKGKTKPRDIYADPYLTFRAELVQKAVTVRSAPILSLNSMGSSLEVLYLTNPVENSDKEYRIRIVAWFAPDESVNALGWYNVEFAFGKRGKATKYATKNTAGPLLLDDARRLLKAIVAEKKKGGYTTNKSGKPFSA